jgi:hypothetical protein
LTVKQLARIRIKSWLKSVALPPTNEYWQFLRHYRFTVEQTLRLIHQFLAASDLQTCSLSGDAGLVANLRQSEYDPYLIFLLKRMGEAMDEEYQQKTPQVVTSLCSDDSTTIIKEIVPRLEKLGKVSTSCPDEVALLKNILESVTLEV